MAQNPIGTITDEERLVPLLSREGAFFVDVTEPVRTADVPEAGTFAWRLREEGDVPRLTFAPVDDPDEAGSLPARELSAADDALVLELPEPLLADGLDLDTDAYDGDTPLLFKPDEITGGIAVGMSSRGEPGGAVEAAIELVPVRFADGTPYRDEPVSDESTNSDPVAETELARGRDEDGTPRSGTVSAPVDAAVLDAVVESTDAPREAIVRGLEAISRHDLVGEADDATPYDPLAVGDRVLIALDEDTWTERVEPELDVDDAALEAIREIYARQADDMLPRTEADRERFEEHVPVVI